MSLTLIGFFILFFILLFGYVAYMGCKYAVTKGMSVPVRVEVPKNKSKNSKRRL